MPVSHDDYYRQWWDDIDDWDGEQATDMEARMEARTAAVAAGGIELGYVSTPTGFTTTSTAAGGVVIPSLSLTVVVAARPIVVWLRGDAWNASGSLGGKLLLDMDGSHIGGFGSVLGDNYVPLVCRRRLAPSTGLHTFTVYGTNNSPGTLTVLADAGTGNLPSAIAMEVVEV